MKSMKGESNRTILIYVDSYQDRVPVGRFHIAADPETTAFRSLSQLLLDINDSLDKENFPQSFYELRRFYPQPKHEAAAEESYILKRGALASFSVRLLFRQNASWQGILTWIEGGQEQYFRSVLEFLLLLDNALGYGQLQ